MKLHKMSLQSLFFLAIAIGLIVFGVYQREKLIPLATPLLEKTKTIDTAKIAEYAKFDPKELETISQRGQEVTSQATKVLGATISESQNTENEKPLYTKAVEYGRYLYCQEVVKQYEKENPTN